MTNLAANAKSGRSNAALIVSIIAVVVSVAAFAWPLIRQVSSEDAAVRAFLDNITESSSRAQLVAVNRTQADSAASNYAYVLGDIWEAWESSEGRGQIKAGDFHPTNDNKWSVCFPKIDLLPGSCQDFGDFQFEPNTTNITRFSVDDIPVGELVSRKSSSITTSEDVGPRVYKNASLTDPDFKKETIVLWTAMRDGQTFPKDSTYRLDSVVAQTEREIELEKPILRFPSSIARYESVLGAVRTLESANLLYACWTYEPEASEVCNWLNLSL
jgi:hypothetical protein